MKVGINGFGRIGKSVYKVLKERGYDVPQINDPFLTPEYLCYMLKYDSTYGPASETISFDGDTIKYGNSISKLTGYKDPSEIPWDVDVVIESTGVFVSKEECEKHNCKKVIITAPSKDANMYVRGVNCKEYKGEKVISNASCTTNCLAPIVKIIDDEFEIEKGLMTTIHACTATQKLVDGISKKDWRGGRSGMQNIIPSTTGAASAVTKVIPRLSGKLTGMAMRVPVPNVSVVDFTFSTRKPASMKKIEEAIDKASKGPMKGIVDVTKEQVVSSDFNRNSNSSIFDSLASIELDDHFFKVIAWYDNEYGYSCRVVDMIDVVTRK